MAEITLPQMQQQVDAWIKTTGVRYFSELTNLGILMEEVGELARLMVREYGEQSYKAGERAAHAPEALADEMADVLWVLMCLANQTHVNLEPAWLANMEKKNFRDARRHLDNDKLKGPPPAG